MHKILASQTLLSACECPVVFSGTHWNCHFTVVFFCRDTPEGKDIAVVKQGSTAVPCLQYFIRKEDTSKL